MSRSNNKCINAKWRGDIAETDAATVAIATIKESASHQAPGGAKERLCGALTRIVDITRVIIGEWHLESRRAWSLE